MSGSAQAGKTMKTENEDSLSSTFFASLISYTLFCSLCLFGLPRCQFQTCCPSAQSVPLLLVHVAIVSVPQSENSGVFEDSKNSNFQESPRQTKPKKGPKRKVHEFWCFSLGKQARFTYRTFVPECPCEKFMNWPFFGLVCRGHSWDLGTL